MTNLALSGKLSCMHLYVHNLYAAEALTIVVVFLVIGMSFALGHLIGAVAAVLRNRGDRRSQR